MIIQQGKFYRTRDGRKIGPMMVDYGVAWPRGKTEPGTPEWMLDGTPNEDFMTGYDALVAEWVEDDTPKTWAEMTEEEQREIAFRAMNGEQVQLYAQGYGWGGWDGQTPFCEIPFPIRIKPKRERVTLYGRNGSDGWAFDYCSGKCHHRITFDVIDGQPDIDTIRMEVLA